jgi:hypothetical protein
MAGTEKESPNPSTTKRCNRQAAEPLRMCEPIYDHTKKGNGTRAFFCSTHALWIYEFPTHLTYTYKDETCYSRRVQL